LINGAEVLGRVQAGQPQNTWQVLRANKGHFRNNLILAIALIVLLGAGVFYLIANPDFVLTYRVHGELDEGAFNIWRTIDFGVAGLLFLIFLYMAYSAFRNLETAAYQVLVLMPEGAVIYKGAKEPEIIDFGTLSDLRHVRKRDDETLVLKNAATGKDSRIELDDRFGKASPLMKNIVNGYHQYRQYHASQGNANPAGAFPPDGGPIPPR
jgi:hypothetical protein